MQVLAEWLPGSRAEAPELQCTGLVALRHVESSWIRDQIHVPCIGRRILCHWTTREICLIFSHNWTEIIDLGRGEVTGVKQAFHHIVSIVYPLSVTSSCGCWPWSPAWDGICQVSLLWTDPPTSLGYALGKKVVVHRPVPHEWGAS